MALQAPIYQIAVLCSVPIVENYTLTHRFLQSLPARGPDICSSLGGALSSPLRQLRLTRQSRLRSETNTSQFRQFSGQQVGRIIYRFEQHQKTNSQ